MKIRPEEIDVRIGDCIEVWKTARQHCTLIAEEQSRRAAERIADELRDEAIRDCLSSLYKQALKRKKGKNDK